MGWRNCTIPFFIQSTPLSNASFLSVDDQKRIRQKTQSNRSLILKSSNPKNLSTDKNNPSKHNPCHPCHPFKIRDSDQSPNPKKPTSRPHQADFPIHPVYYPLPSLCGYTTVSCLPGGLLATSESILCPAREA
jgi:hypothetical protein